MEEDGNLVLYNNSTLIWAANTHGSGATFAVMQLDVNFVLYTPDNTPKWSTQTDRDTKPRQIIKADGVLRSGEQLTCGPTGRYELKHQKDGNVVLYDNGRATWATDTMGKKTTEFVMQLDSNLVLYEPGKAAWATGTWNKGGAEAVLQDDGNFVMYRPDREPVWATNTSN